MGEDKEARVRRVVEQLRQLDSSATVTPDTLSDDELLRFEREVQIVIDAQSKVTVEAHTFEFDLLISILEPIVSGQIDTLSRQVNVAGKSQSTWANDEKPLTLALTMITTAVRIGGYVAEIQRSGLVPDVDMRNVQRLLRGAERQIEEGLESSLENQVLESRIEASRALMIESLRILKQAVKASAGRS